MEKIVLVNMFFLSIWPYMLLENIPGPTWSLPLAHIFPVTILWQQLRVFQLTAVCQPPQWSMPGGGLCHFRLSPTHMLQQHFFYLWKWLTNQGRARGTVRLCHIVTNITAVVSLSSGAACDMFSPPSLPLCAPAATGSASHHPPARVRDRAPPAESILRWWRETEPLLEAIRHISRKKRNPIDVCVLHRGRVYPQLLWERAEYKRTFEFDEVQLLDLK